MLAPSDEDGSFPWAGVPLGNQSDTWSNCEMATANGADGVSVPAFGDAQTAAGGEGAVAVVSLDEDQWSLSESTPLTIGRQSTCDVQIGVASPGPEDRGVSRRAGTLICAQGRTWVRNDSATQPVYVRPSVGEELILDRRGTIVSLADGHFIVALEGQIRSYVFHIERLGLGSDTEDEPLTASPPTIGALTLSPRERRVLAAICEPLFARPGIKVRPASYREAATRLSLSEHTVRNQLDAIRERLLALGIPRLIGAEAKNDLARYAVRSGSITLVDVAAIDLGHDEP